MNQRLIEDEGSRNPMLLVELERRFRGWLDAGWQADLFFEAEQCVGYALYQRRVHEYNANLPEIYLRQFFIDRGHRGRRVGTSAFLLLRQHRFSEPCKVVVEVLASNARGQGFWARLGFCPHVYGLELDLGTPPSEPRARALG